MRITKNSQQVQSLKSLRDIANAGCDVCPCCGERKTLMEYITQGVLFKGIDNSTCIKGSKGFFKIRMTQIDCYHCHTCGAEWQSEEYFTS